MHVGEDMAAEVGAPLEALAAVAAGIVPPLRVDLGVTHHVAVTLEGLWAVRALILPLAAVGNKNVVLLSGNVKNVQFKGIFQGDGSSRN